MSLGGSRKNVNFELQIKQIKTTDGRSYSLEPWHVPCCRAQWQLHSLWQTLSFHQSVAAKLPQWTHVYERITTPSNTPTLWSRLSSVPVTHTHTHTHTPHTHTHTHTCTHTCTTVHHYDSISSLHYSNSETLYDSISIKAAVTASYITSHTVVWQCWRTTSKVNGKCHISGLPSPKPLGRFSKNFARLIMLGTLLHTQVLGSIGSKGACLRMCEIVTLKRLFFLFLRFHAPRSAH